MTKNTNERRRRQAGFTYMEVAVGMTLSTIVVAATISVTKTTQTGQQQIVEQAKKATSARRAHNLLAVDLRMAKCKGIDLTTSTATGNSTLEFNTLVDHINGAPVYGVRAAVADATTGLKYHVGWRLRYRVATKIVSLKERDHYLLREKLDESGKVQASLVVAKLESARLFERKPVFVVTAPTKPSVAWHVEYKVFADENTKETHVAFDVVPNN